ncbi:MAG: glycosyltransferase involved in cell wall biosynthesis [Candidatus Nanohaloarchaea archaeon]|jgi:glycosyltransferase involved in cell wall biosynthesis
MDIAIFQPWLKEKGGMEKVVLEYARRSENNVTILTPFYSPENTFEGFQELEVEEIGWQGEADGFISRLLKFSLGGALTRLDLENYNAVIFSTSGVSTPFTVRNHNQLTLGYCHTPLRAVLPEFKDSYRNDLSPVLKPFFGLATWFFGKLEKFSWRFFDHTFVNSENTKERVVRRGLETEENLTVLNPGADVEENKSESYDKYFLYPTRFRRYKRHELAIEAFKQAELDKEFELVLAGSAQEEDYLEELKEMAGENVRFEEDVSDERWRELYSRCYSVLFCAEKEDWGIIPVEAGSYSKPIISVNEGGPLESVKDGETGFLVEPEPEAFARKMEHLASNPEKVREIGEKAQHHSKKYSWNRFAEKLDTRITALKASQTN